MYKIVLLFCFNQLSVTMQLLFKTTLFASFAFCILVFDGCKKGEHDPFISLRSRKARVAGEWKLTGGSLTTSGGPQTIVTTYDGTNKTDGSTTTAYTENSTFEKRGDYKIVISDDGKAKVQEGTWDFTAGAGSAKKKERLIITILKEIITIGSTTTTYTYFGSGAPVVVYEINELRNKKMVLKLDGSQSSGSITTAVIGSLTYEQ